MKCRWCEVENPINRTMTTYWELPSGLRAIQLKAVPSIYCSHCHIEEVDETILEELEDQLLLVDESAIPDETTYELLMKMPRRLKRNYFKL